MNYSDPKTFEDQNAHLPISDSSLHLLECFERMISHTNRIFPFKFGRYYGTETACTVVIGDAEMFASGSGEDV
jgi:hypothetical protein